MSIPPQVRKNIQEIRRITTLVDDKPANENRWLYRIEVKYKTIRIQEEGFFDHELQDAYNVLIKQLLKKIPIPYTFYQEYQRELNAHYSE